MCYDLHTNISEAVEIIKIFIDKNFIVDIINVCESSFRMLIKENRYDIIFGLGMPYSHACKLNPKALKILYLTENSPSAVSEKFKERVDYYYRRKGIKRTGITRQDLYDENQLLMSDIGILLTNAYNARHSKKYFQKQYLLKPTGFTNNNYIWEEKTSETKKHFVWFGSQGAIHKGLDLLVDVFNNTEMTLHVCGLSPKEKNILTGGANIIDHGFVNCSSNDFLRLARECAYVVFPSCSEGMSTSVITCMLHGLIPVVTKDTGIDVFDFGYEMDSFLVEDIANLLQKLSLISDEELNIRSKKTYIYAGNNFTLQYFKTQFKNIIDDIFIDNI
jgi:hypothetical protein